MTTPTKDPSKIVAATEAREPWARPTCGVCGGWGFVWCLPRDGGEKVRVDCGGCREASQASTPLCDDAALIEAHEAGRQKGLHEAADMVVKLGYAWTGLHGAIVGLGDSGQET